MPETIRKFNKKPRCGDDFTGRAFDIVKYGHNSSAALLKAFYDVKNNRGASRGAATDEEQDILRAMIVTAGACIDSTLKQLFRDALHELAQYDDCLLYTSPSPRDRG